MAAAYLKIIQAQGNEPLDSAFVLGLTGLILAAALAAALGAGSSDDRVAARLTGSASGWLIGLGLIGIFSIGIGLLVAGSLAGAAAFETETPSWPWGLAATLGALASFVLLKAMTG